MGFNLGIDTLIGANNQSNYVILQEYVEGAEQGDVRILLAMVKYVEESASGDK